MRLRPFRPLAPSVALAALGASLALAAASAGPAAEPVAPPTWQRAEQAIGDGRLEEASRDVGALLERARAAGAEQEIARALVERARLRIALGGFETAVEELAAADWPRDSLARSTVQLYFARTLVEYQQRYAWQIQQRERVASDEAVDLDLWTSGQLAAETRRHFAALFARRALLGDEPKDASFALEPNTYPPGVRDTLRDAVSYLFAHELANSSRWRPAERELWRLDLPALLAGAGPVDEATLADPETHPVAALAAVLGDLERWHGGRGEPAAELEAMLIRLDLLREHWTGSTERATIEAALDDALPRFTDDPWWSRGMAARAEWRRQDDRDPKALVDARALALAGERAFPESWGAAYCRRIRAEIEAPALEVAAMAFDAPGKRSVEVTYANLERIRFRAFKIDVERRLDEPWTGSLAPRTDAEIDELLRGEPAAEWSVELPATLDFRRHRAFVVPPIAAKGSYVLVASEGENNFLAAIPFTLSDLVLLIDDGATIDLRAVDGESGAPRPGVDVTLYRYDWRTSRQVFPAARTDHEGRARFSSIEPARGDLLLRARGGDDETVAEVHGGWRRDPPEAEEERALLFTDRVIYRPGQAIRWKVLAFTGREQIGEYRLVAKREVAIALVDPNGERVAEATATTNDFGSASGELRIPAGRPLGDWTIQATPAGFASIAVEEYKRPTFEVEIGAPAEALRLGAPAKLSGTARYYFGLPVAGGEVAWRIERDAERPRRLGPWTWRIWPPALFESRVVASGRARLDGDGRFEVELTPEADPKTRGSGATFRYRLTADVTDDGGETRGASRSFRIGWVAVEAAVANEEALHDAARRVELAILRTDLDGAARAGTASYRLFALDATAPAPLPAELPADPPIFDAASAEPTAGDRLRPRWSESPPLEEYLARAADAELIRSGALGHGEDGRARLELGRLPPGAYRLRYETADRFGERFELASEFVVAGNRTPLPAPLALRFAEPAVEPGGTARLFLGSGLPGQTIYVEQLRGNDVLARWTRIAGRDSDWIEIPVGPELRGGFAVRATLVADHQDVHAGTALEVPWSDRRLDVSFSTFRDRLRPGAKDRFAITVRGDDGKLAAEGSAEVLASMYDRSLDALREFERPSLDALYPRWSWMPGWTQTTLGSSGAIWQRERWQPSLPEIPPLIGDRFRSIDPYGIGGPGARGGIMTFGRMEMVARSPQASDVAAAPMEYRQDVTVTAEAPTVVVSHATAASKATGRFSAKVVPPPVELRSSFAETAFFEPHLLTNEDGSVSFEFEVPDSVTSWKVWAVAATRALALGQAQRTAESVKELLVRPYLPRFLREGDRASLRVLVQNAGEERLTGEARLAIRDPESDEDLAAAFGLSPESLAAPFTVEPGASATLEFPLTAPARMGSVAVRVEARAGAFSDGELRPLPILPARVRLAQSRFVALSGTDRRELDFADLREDDPTRENEQLVVTVDGQLFYSALDALPYLVDYPYECTEQTLNRFLSTGILASLYHRYPAVGAMAKELSTRATRFERFDADDPNRRLALEETPWLAASRGGDDEARDLLRVLDPEIAATQRRASLAKLEAAQLPSGAFPWFPGGPPSAWSTLYMMYGFAKAAEFGVEVPEAMVRQGWRYLGTEARADWLPRAESDSCCYESLTFLAYVASSYPDRSWLEPLLATDELDRILDLAFGHRRDLAPMTKLMLSMALARAGRAGDARRVLASVMDSARSDPDLGTYWAPEERSWLWYNDTVETHAWAIRALLEVAPEDPRLPGLVQWVFLQKQLGHWKSTRATAEVLYSLAKYLAATGTLAAREEIRVAVDPVTATFVFAPDRFTGKRNQLVVDGAKLGAASSTVVAEKGTPGLAFVSATWHFSTEQLPEESRGDLLRVERSYFRRDTSGPEPLLLPLGDGAAIRVGDELEVRLDLVARAPAEYIHLRDPRPAGCEPMAHDSGWRFDGGVASYREIRDSGVDFFFERLPQGRVTLTHRLRATTAGLFRAAPAQLQSIYAPEFTAYSTGARVTIEPAAP